MNHTTFNRAGQTPRFGFRLGVTLLALTVGILATGCNNAAKPVAPAAMGDAMAIPADIKDTKQLLDVAMLDTMARPNPFQSLVGPKDIPVEAPPTDVPTDTTAAVTPEAPPPPNPFDGFTLTGIFYRGNKSMAILSTPDDKTKIVHLGDTLAAGDENMPMQIQVAKIGKTAMTMIVLNPPSELPAENRSMQFKLASLVGQEGKGGAGNGGGKRPKKGKSPDAGAKTAEGDSPNGASTASSGTGDGKSKVPKEIEDLMNGTGNGTGAQDGAPAGKGKGAAPTKEKS